MTEPPKAEEPGRGLWSGVFGWLVTALIGVAAVWVVLWSGLAFNIVTTDSMEPTLYPSDMVITVGPNAIQPEIGDVVVFTARFLETDIPPHVHRIIGVEPDGNWITKGDNATNPDPWRVNPQAVTGTMIGSAPTKLIRSPLLLGLGMFVVLAILFWPRKGKDDQPPASDDDTTHPHHPEAIPPTPAE